MEINYCGYGNCFYHTVVECLKHKSRPININHTDLRNSVVDYVRCNRISEFVTTWLPKNINCDLDFVLEKQGHEGEYANELFIRGTSLFLDIAIFFTRSTSTLFIHMMYFGQWNQYHQINPWRITLVSIY